jgi:hypothetical protein
MSASHPVPFNRVAGIDDRNVGAALDIAKENIAHIHVLGGGHSRRRGKKQKHQGESRLSQTRRQRTHKSSSPEQSAELVAAAKKGMIWADSSCYFMDDAAEILPSPIRHWLLSNPNRRPIG